MITLLSFIATLLIIVFVHEFGHYCAARFFWCSGAAVQRRFWQSAVAKNRQAGDGLDISANTTWRLCAYVG